MDLGKSTIAKQRSVKRTIAGDTCTVKFINSKIYNLKFQDISNFSLNLHTKEKKLIQIYLVI
jgi:hypothetical protein